MSFKLLSIIIPTFNRSHGLSILLDSIPSRLFPHLQIIVIDDGSTDNTNRVISKYQSSNYPIDYYYQENSGRHSALKTSLGYINSEYTMIFDSDDIFYPYGLDIVVDHLSSDSTQYDVYLFPMASSRPTSNRSTLPSDPIRPVELIVSSIC